MKMYGPEFVWILHPNAGTIEDWAELAEKEDQENSCTKTEFQKAAERAFILEKNILYRTDENTTTASGLVCKLCFNDLNQSGHSPCRINHYLKHGRLRPKIGLRIATVV